MPRAVDGTRRADRRKKILEQAKGFFGRRSTNFRVAKDAVRKSLQYAYRDRKNKKRDLRRLWISRISAAVRAEGMTYSRFIEGMNKANIAINRLALSNLAIEDPAAFSAVVAQAKSRSRSVSMINLDQVRQLQAKVQEAVGLIAKLKEENQGLKDTISVTDESKIGELESAMSLIREDQHEIEEGIQEALTKLDSIGSVHPSDQTPPAVSQPLAQQDNQRLSRNPVAEDRCRSRVRPGCSRRRRTFRTIPSEESEMS
jgi:large subunit ribosomal protein L20